MAGKDEEIPTSPGLTTFGALEKEEKGISWLGQGFPWSKSNKSSEEATVVPGKQGVTVSFNSSSRPGRRLATTEPSSQRRASAASAASRTREQVSLGTHVLVEEHV